MAGVSDGATLPELVGRSRPLAQLAEAVDRGLHDGRSTVLVAGQAGIGKTSLVRAAVAGAGARVGWGTCIDVGGAPGYWPWTQVLDGLVRSVGLPRARQLAGDDAPLLATIAPALGEPTDGEASDRARLLLMDATARFLDALAGAGPLVVVLDDLQWADESSLVLLDFVARAPGPAGLCLIGAYRHDELADGVRRHLAPLVSHGHRIELDGIGVDAVRALVERVSGRPVDGALAAAVHQRTGGHPFFVREVALAADRAGLGAEHVPGAVRDAIGRKVDRLPAATRAMLEVAAVAAPELRPDVLAAALGSSTVEVDVAARHAVEAGVFTAGPDALRFTHDLWRETILAGVEPPRRIAVHRAVAAALEDRAARRGPVVPSEVARHSIAAIALDGPERATRWALEAAAADSAALAFGEAAAQLRRLRAAVADSGAGLDDHRLVDVLLAESEALARGGSAVDARGLLRVARDVADRAGDTARTARVALATAQLGARFSARRDEVVAELEHALAAVTAGEADPVLEARLSAALARELQHSVAEDRPRAGPLSERALELGRRTADPATLAACLLARHDVVWTPGTAVERAEIAGEIVEVAVAAGDPERQADGHLLLANALLEQGSGAYRAALDRHLALLDQLAQPRHRYVAETRRACLHLLGGDLAAAAATIDSAVAMGERIREPDTGNVAMSQRLELVRAGGDQDELRAFARAAVEHWTGAPIHAHAVAAGFHTRAGDLDAAAHHVATVVDLGTWRADRSYLWSVLVRELAWAAAALQDRELCSDLLDDVAPLATTCGVNGAVVAFAGCHAHTAGLLSAALGRHDAARASLESAVETYRRLGAAGWLVEARHALEAMAPASSPSAAAASMRRDGNLWHLRFAGRSATTAHTKGLADIARLVTAPNTDVHVLDLAGASDRSGPAGTVVDRRALDAYRGRLRDLDDDAEEAARHHDEGRIARVAVERQALLDELGRITGPAGQPRQFANHPAERARKAVTARVRDAIRKLHPVLPELATHLESTIITGTYCRYRTDEACSWSVDLGRAPDAPDPGR